MANHLEQLSKIITEQIMAHLYGHTDLEYALLALEDEDEQDIRRSIESIIENVLYAESERGDR